MQQPDSVEKRIANEIILITSGTPDNERINAMKDTETGNEILASEVSDEALEAAAGVGREKAANYTGMFCSDLSTCPE
jgi:hypothetical protein